jgi:hypothetical protein
VAAWQGALVPGSPAARQAARGPGRGPRVAVVKLDCPFARLVAFRMWLPKLECCQDPIEGIAGKACCLPSPFPVAFSRSVILPRRLNFAALCKFRRRQISVGYFSPEGSPLPPYRSWFQKRHLALEKGDFGSVSVKFTKTRVREKVSYIIYLSCCSKESSKSKYKLVGGFIRRGRINRGGCHTLQLLIVTKEHKGSYPPHRRRQI